MEKLNTGSIIQTDEGLFVVIRKESKESYECVKISDGGFETLSYEEILSEEVTGVIER